ncbi:MAG: hypothetical protein HY696_08985 [Deltaproteobacteria bacterium]|nr:hypothetical protein [Deltaproteobacteria bacterium]
MQCRNRSVVGMLLLLAACGGSGGGSAVSSASPEVQQAIDNAESVDKTIYVELSAGSVEGVRERMAEAFPEVATLMAGGDSGRAAMLEAFTGTPAYVDDVRLAIYAHALEQMGDTASLATLRTFLDENISGDLYLAPQFITHAIRSLAGESTTTLFFSPTDMAAAVGSANLAARTASARAVTAASLSCARAVAVLDAQGNVATYLDDHGDPQRAVLVGYEFTASRVSDEEAALLIEQVTTGGGTYVTDNTEFRGVPSGQFNCGGYAFRSLNNDDKWRLDPALAFEVLTKTGSLVEVSESEARAGDKVFYFTSAAATRPGHVAEVDSVSGLISQTITIRNADNNTGLWEAPINAAYFSGSWIPGSSARYPVRKVYRWAGGVEPVVGHDPSATGTDYCDPLSQGLSANVAIIGYSVTFTPTTVTGANNGEYTGDVHLTDVVGITAYEGSGSSMALALMLFDRLSIAGAGEYTLNTTDNVFDRHTGSAALSFTSPSITNADDGSSVGFESTGGSVTLTSWGTAIGDQIIGTYLATVSGTRVTGLDAWGSPQSETLTGTISGSFNVEITAGN